MSDSLPPGSSVHGILQARTLEWVVISFSRGSSWTQGSKLHGERKKKKKEKKHIQLETHPTINSDLPPGIKVMDGFYFVLGTCIHFLHFNNKLA